MNKVIFLSRLCSVFLLSMICMFAFSQGKQVQGVVKDATGEPIIGANVLVKGTTNGVITDFDGNYSLTNVNSQDVIVFSYIGYTSQEIKVGSQTTINVTLKEDTETLEEVVVVGYGTVKRRDLTGSVASVTGEKLAANPVANVAEALQGQLPGVSVTSQDGRPGAGMSIRIRGGGSITQSNDPLFIVDGVQVSGIDDIPADNIESIDVLKDAASTAIYGARGANGVILVTTKGAKEGRPVIKYNMYYQIKTNPKTLDVLDAYDIVYHTWAYATAYGESYGQNVAKYFGLGSANGNHLEEYRNMSSHNYIDDVMQTAGSWNHDLSLSGGNEKTKYYASLNYTDDEGIRINSGFSRWSANFKFSQKINKKLTFDADLRYTEVKVNGAKFDKATSAYQYRPIDTPLGEDSYNLMGQGDVNVDPVYNPVSIINNYENIIRRNRIRARGALSWNILEGLTARTELSLSRNWTKQQEWNAGNDPSETAYSVAELTNKDGYDVRWATTLNYEVQGLNEDNSLSFLLGNEVLASREDKSYMKGAGYPSGFTMDDAFGMINMTDSSLGQDQFLSTLDTPSHTQSWFARANYSWKSRYLLTATFRADGSSKFAPGNQWGYFPAAAVAWRISDEPFMESARNWLDNLKLRLSYGTSGSDNIDPSLWRETWETENITVDGQPTTIYKPGEMMGNENLKWETTVSRNLGLDFGFFNNRIRGSIDAYWNTTKNILMKVPIEASVGYSYQFQNVGRTSNKGMELALGVDLVRSKNFNLTLNATYNFNKNNIDELADNVLADTHTGWGSTMRKPYYDYIIREGQPVGLIQGYKSVGFYTVDDFNYDATTGVYTLKEGIPDIQGIANYPSGISGFKRPAGQNAFPGAAKFENVNGDDVVNEDDVTIIGKTMPKHTGGFTFNGNYKSFDFTLGFTYQIGGDVYNAAAMSSMNGGKDYKFGGNRLKLIEDTYKLYDINESGDIYLVTDPNHLNEMNINAKYPVFYSEYSIVSSDFIEDASYLRLQNLTIGYTFPKKWMEKLLINNLRIYFTGSNLFCLTGYSGIDPDVNVDNDAGGDGFPTPSYDFNAYPKARTYTFGLNLTF